MPKAKKDNHDRLGQLAVVVLSRDRKASIHWQCSLEEREEQLHRHPIGEAGLQLPDRQDQVVLAKTANQDIKFQLLINSSRIINLLSSIVISVII
jgi:hypothetical protein